MRAITSTYYLMLKSTTESGVTELKGDQTAAWRYYAVFLKDPTAKETLIVESVQGQRWEHTAIKGACQRARRCFN
jgi:hypothetical protein